MKKFGAAICFSFYTPIITYQPWIVMGEESVWIIVLSVLGLFNIAGVASVWIVVGMESVWIVVLEMG
jgi:hypothetical protein